MGGLEALGALGALGALEAMAALRGLGAMGNLEGLGHTDRYDIQFCRLITKNYSNSFSVLMGVWGLGGTPSRKN